MSWNATGTLALAAGLLLAVPQAAAAQSVVGNDGWWEWAVPALEGRGNQGRQGHGPPFCRNGRGHPVHGQAWCQAKGWTATWQRTRWDDVVLRDPRQRRSGRVYEQDTLAEILGRVVFGRVESQRRRVGAGGPLQGRWLSLIHI